MHINVVNLFAGHGGFTEGFAASDVGKSFRILLSTETDRTICRVSLD
jgi:site-specific DNA-cytosine methylase